MTRREEGEEWEEKDEDQQSVQNVYTPAGGHKGRYVGFIDREKMEDGLEMEGVGFERKGRKEGVICKVIRFTKGGDVEGWK